MATQTNPPPTGQSFDFKPFKDWFYKLWQNVKGITTDSSGNVTITGNVTVTGNQVVDGNLTVDGDIDGVNSYTVTLAVYAALISGD